MACQWVTSQTGDRCNVFFFVLFVLLDLLSNSYILGWYSSHSYSLLQIQHFLKAKEQRAYENGDRSAQTLCMRTKHMLVAQDCRAVSNTCPHNASLSTFSSLCVHSIRRTPIFVFLERSLPVSYFYPSFPHVIIAPCPPTGTTWQGLALFSHVFFFSPFILSCFCLRVAPHARARYCFIVSLKRSGMKGGLARLFFKQRRSPGLGVLLKKRNIIPRG